MSNNIHYYIKFYGFSTSPKFKFLKCVMMSYYIHSWVKLYGAIKTTRGL